MPTEAATAAVAGAVSAAALEAAAAGAAGAGSCCRGSSRGWSAARLQRLWLWQQMLS
jgi:hypothetical protein